MGRAARRVDMGAEAPHWETMSMGGSGIIITGAPASGKGTQCEYITERFGVVFNDFKFGTDPNAPPGSFGKPTATGQIRTPKGSAVWLSAVWQRNALVYGSPRCYLLGAGMWGANTAGQRGNRPVEHRGGRLYWKRFKDTV